jgi:hypothetical protein
VPLIVIELIRKVYEKSERFEDAFAFVLDISEERKLSELEKSEQLNSHFSSHYNFFLGKWKNEKVDPRSELKKLFFRMMKEKEQGFGPNISNYNILINLSDSLIQAFDLFDEMKRKNFIPNAATFTILLKLCFKNRDLNSALILCREIGSRRLDLSESMLAYLLDLMNEEENGFSHSMEVFAKTQSKEASKTMMALLNFCSQKRRIADGLKILNEFAKHKITPREENYIALIDSCIANNDLNMLIRIYSHMKTSLPKISLYTYRKLIGAQWKKEHFNEVQICYEDFRNAHPLSEKNFEIHLVFFRYVMNNQSNPDLLRYFSREKNFGTLNYFLVSLIQRTSFTAQKADSANH